MPNALLVAVYACAGFAGLCLVLSILTREYSWVDRMWSIVPALYVGWFAYSAGRFDARLAIMTALVIAWSVRLTYNFIRKGGFRPGGEDYRWAVLRANMTRAQFAVFNVVFICATQHALVLAFSLPAWVAARQSPTPLNALDALAAVLFALFLAGETIADQQQWNFHRRKAALAGAGPQFLTEGLFRYSRHPNFFCEQALWWSFYLFSIAAGASWWNPSLAGPVLLTALFHGSTDFTEKITASKYPEYADYQRTTSRLIPWFPGK